jgi:hypothetical protein
LDSYPASPTALHAATTTGGLAAIQRFAPAQRHQLVLGLQRTSGNAAVRQFLNPIAASSAIVQRDGATDAEKLVEVASTPPEVTTPPMVTPPSAPVTWGAGGKESKPEVDVNLGVEGEGTAETKSGEETKEEQGGSAKFSVETTVPLWKDTPGIGPVMILKEFSFEQGVAWKLKEGERKLLPKYAMGAALKALSLDFENIKPPFQIPGKLGIAFDASIFGAAELEGNKKTSFKVGGQLGAEAKYQFKNSPIFINGKLAGQIYWGNLTENGASATFTGSSYSGFLGLGAHF